MVMRGGGWDSYGAGPWAWPPPLWGTGPRPAPSVVITREGMDALVLCMSGPPPAPRYRCSCPSTHVAQPSLSGRALCQCLGSSHGQVQEDGPGLRVLCEGVGTRSAEGEDGALPTAG